MTNIYVGNTPQGTQTPAASYPQISANFQYLESFGDTDHQFTANDSTANDGTHKKVTLNDQASDPSFTGSDSVLYSKDVSGTSQLFFRNSAGVSQLSGGSAATSGYTYLPAGILMQWGQATGVYRTGATAVTFPIAFSAAPYSITYSMFYPSYPGSYSVSNLIKTGSITTTQFYPLNNDGVARTILWLAIGPA